MAKLLHFMSVNNPSPIAFSRYLPVEADALRWGMHVLDVGHASTPPHSPYPLGDHPSAYLMTWEHGRVLDEFQLLYITRGRGQFGSAAPGGVPVAAGHALLLFPGVWHRYRPLAATGWDELWIGFGGEQARRIMEGFFSPQQAVLPVGLDEELLRLMRSVGALLASPPPGYAQLMAARTCEALAQLRSLAAGRDQADRRLARKLEQARCTLLERAESNIHLPDLAQELGMSYSSFRKAFRRETGASPRQYQLEIRLNKARELLRSGALGVTEVAERVGFSSVYYFSRLFKRKIGCSPSAWRRIKTSAPSEG